MAVSKCYTSQLEQTDGIYLVIYHNPANGALLHNNVIEELLRDVPRAKIWLILSVILS